MSSIFELVVVHLVCGFPISGCLNTNVICVCNHRVFDVWNYLIVQADYFTCIGIAIVWYTVVYVFQTGKHNIGYLVTISYSTLP